MGRHRRWTILGGWDLLLRMDRTIRFNIMDCSSDCIDHFGYIIHSRVHFVPDLSQ